MSTADMLQLVQIGSSIVAVSIAVMALMHRRSQDTIGLRVSDAGSSTRTVVTLEEFAEKFNRAFGEIEKLGGRFHDHEMDCTQAKTLLAERQAEAAKAMERVMDRLENLNRQIGFTARDVAAADTARKLGQS